MTRPRLQPFAALALALLLPACGADTELSVYVALDQEHSQRLIDDFAKQSGLQIKARYDTEASKTVGLVSAIIEEAARPRCDVFWNNETVQTVRLAQRDLVTPYVSPNAQAIPAQYKDAGGKWTGFAARARVFIVNTEAIPDPADYPKSIWDLHDAKWRGKCAVARPLTGTTLSHFAALRSVLGEAKWNEFVDGLFANDVAFLQSNGATMRETAAGKFAFALTDTDDFHVALQKGHPVACVFPDQADLGTMLLPNSVAMIAGGPNPENAQKFIDWALSEQVEALLAAAKSAQIPLRASVPGPTSPQILGIGAFREMQWDAEQAARDLEFTSTYFVRRFER